MDSLREKVLAREMQTSAFDEVAKRPEDNIKPRIWKVVIIASLSECKIDGEYVAV